MYSNIVVLNIQILELLLVGRLFRSMYFLISHVCLGGCIDFGTVVNVQPLLYSMVSVLNIPPPEESLSRDSTDLTYDFKLASVDEGISFMAYWTTALIVR
jgi:hypothetical protein